MPVLDYDPFFDHSAAGDCHYVHFPMGEFGHAAVPDAFDDHMVIDVSIVAHEVAASENNSHTRARHHVTVKIPIPEMIIADEHELIFVKAEIELDPHPDALIINETDTGLEAGGGRQGRPATITVGLPPTNPGWPPDVVGHPEPAAQRIAKPAAIMKDNIAPGIIRLPIPARLGVDPTPLVKVRTPVETHQGFIGPPAKAVLRHLNPSAERG